MGLDLEWQPKPVELFQLAEEKKVVRFYQHSSLGLAISKKIFHSQEVSIYFDSTALEQKIKIIIKKKDYPLAVTRNKTKRWLREVFREFGLGPGFVVVVRKGLFELGFKDIKDISRPHLVGFKKPPECL